MMHFQLYLFDLTGAMNGLVGKANILFILIVYFGVEISSSDSELWLSKDKARASPEIVFLIF